MSKKREMTDDRGRWRQERMSPATTRLGQFVVERIAYSGQGWGTGGMP